MTDARHPERWLNDLRFHEISAEDYRAYSFALMWSVANRTDGIITPTRLRLIPTMTEEAPPRLVDAALWVVINEGWLIDSFVVTQTSKRELDALEAKRAKDAGRKRLERLGHHVSPVQSGVPVYVRSDVQSDTPRTAKAPATATAPGQEVLEAPQSRNCGQCGKVTTFSLVLHQGALVCRKCAYDLRSVA